LWVIAKPSVGSPCRLPWKGCLSSCGCPVTDPCAPIKYWLNIQLLSVLIISLQDHLGKHSACSDQALEKKGTNHGRRCS
jgi:hypothetical protein